MKLEDFVILNDTAQRLIELGRDPHITHKKIYNL